MASIQKKGKVYYVVTNIHGRQKWINVGTSKKEALKRKKEIESDIFSQLQIETIKLKDFINNWLNTYCATNLKETTIRNYKGYINNYILPRLGNIYIQDIKPLHLQNFVYDLLKNGRIKSAKPLNPKTVIQAFRIISKCLNSAVKLQLLEYNPCNYVDLPRKKKINYNWLSTKNEIIEFINNFKNTDLFLPVLVSITLGLRRGEVLGLKWTDIDYDNKTIFIQRTIINGLDNIVKVDTPKTEDSTSLLLVPDKLIDIFESLEKPYKFIFTYEDGNIINPASFSRKYSAYRDTKRLKKVRFQDLRHSNASFLYRNNVDLKLIQERLRHSTISTTMDVYTHTNVNNQLEAVKKINDLI